MRYELEPNQYVLRVYDDHAENYIASALIRVYGDRAWVSSISSPRLFEALPLVRMSKCAGRNMEWVVISKRDVNGS